MFLAFAHPFRIKTQGFDHCFSLANPGLTTGAKTPHSKRLAFFLGFPPSARIKILVEILVRKMNQVGLGIGFFFCEFLL